jgi:hypothetical protein
VHIRVHDRGHLRFLYRADLPVGEHYKDRDILLPTQAVDGGRTGITTCCADDSQVLPTSSSLALVPANQEVLKQIAQKLKRDILECECRPVEQLQQMYVLLLVECDGRCDVFRAEGGVAAVDDVFQICGRYL